MHRVVATACVAVAVMVILATHQNAVAAPLNCTVSSSGFSFADYDVFSMFDTTTVLASAVQYTCNKNSTPVSIALGPSMGTNDYAPRTMLQSGEDPMKYYVTLGGFTSACGGGSGVVWGDSALNNDTVSYVAISGRRDLPNDVTAFGCIPHGQNVAGGTHVDSLEVTVSF